MFSEQLAFFRGELAIPESDFTDLWELEHQKGFRVAGLERGDLLDDMRSAIDEAIGEGTTLQQFRRQFDAAVERHGWDYTGGRDWRTQVIYRENLRRSYGAGRRRQQREVQDQRPYWRWRHSEATETPRPQHLEWDGHPRPARRRPLVGRELTLPPNAAPLIEVESQNPIGRFARVPTPTTTCRGCACAA